MSPLKWIGAALTAAVHAKDKGLEGLLEGASIFYKEWAQTRDDLENIVLSRQTKVERDADMRAKLYKQREKAKKEAQRIAEEKRQRLIQERERQAQIEAEKRKEEQYRQDRRTISRMTNRKELNQQRAEFEALYEEYKRLKAGSNVTEFKNWESWDSRQFTHNTEIIQGLIKRERNKGATTWYTPSQRSLQVEAEKRGVYQTQQKPVVHEERYITKEQEQRMNRKLLEKREKEHEKYLAREAYRRDKTTDAYYKSREEFEAVLEEYKSLRPDANLVNYDNYGDWIMPRLNKNTEILKSKIAKIKSRPFWD